MRRALAAALFQTFLLVQAAWPAQSPTGTIKGLVTDAAGVPVVNARITIRHADTGLRREGVRTDAHGAYSAPFLPVGTYRIQFWAEGYPLLEREAVVQVGLTTTASTALGGPQPSAAPVWPDISYDSQQLSETVSRAEIETIPVNGGHILDLVKLVPPAQGTIRFPEIRYLPSLGGDVPGGNNGRNSLVTYDGGSVMTVRNGGAAMGLSKEAVEEFQVVTSSFNLYTGMTAHGAVNVVTRSGANDLAGTGWFSLRDRNLAANPGLARNRDNPEPFFQHRQYGASVGGPIRKSRTFFFANLERNDQRSVAATLFSTPEFEKLGSVTASPLVGTLAGVRVDADLFDGRRVFFRTSHEDGRQFSPVVAQRGRYTEPSNWLRTSAWADQSVAGITSEFSDSLVNDHRVSYLFKSGATGPPKREDCPQCLTIGGPQVTVMGTAGLTLGRSRYVDTLARRLHVSDQLAWRRGVHDFRFGADWSYLRGGDVVTTNEPATISLFAPARVEAYNRLPSTTAEMRVPLPAEFLSFEDLLKLPVQSFTVGAGEPRVPQSDFNRVRTSHVLHASVQDSWRLHPRLYLNYGLAWTLDMQLNHDLRKPRYLEAVLGADNLGPVEKAWGYLSPLVGFAWRPFRTGSLVLRGGAAVYYDAHANPTDPDSERYALSPKGTGRFAYPETRILNPLSGIPGVPMGQPFDLRSRITLFTGERLVEALDGIRARLVAGRNPDNRDFRVTNIEADKTGTVYLNQFRNQYASHVNVGAAYEIAPGTVASADFSYRHFINTNTLIDFNHYNSERGPGLPRCTGAQFEDPGASCSSGPINVRANIGQSRYSAVSLRVQSRLSKGIHVRGSYTYSRNRGLNIDTGSGFNLDNWFESYGPVLESDIPHILDASGAVDLVGGFQLGFNVSYSSPAPFSAWIANNDFNGDGTINDLLPGTSAGRFGRGMGKVDIERLVADFNRLYATRRDRQGLLIPQLALPSNYEFGDSRITQDVRVSRTFAVRQDLRFTFLADVFNLFNIANLQGYTGDLTDPGFGQPLSRAEQAFGSGGPRSFQLGVRVSFGN